MPVLRFRTHRTVARPGQPCILSAWTDLLCHHSRQRLREFRWTADFRNVVVFFIQRSSPCVPFLFIRSDRRAENPPVLAVGEALALCRSPAVFDAVHGFCSGPHELERIVEVGGRAPLRRLFRRLRFQHHRLFPREPLLLVPDQRHSVFPKPFRLRDEHRLSVFEGMLPPASLHEAPNDGPLPYVAQVDVARRQHISGIVQDEAFVNPEHVDLRLRPVSPPRRAPCPAARRSPSSSGEPARRRPWRSRYQAAGFPILVPGMGFGSCDCCNAVGLVRREKSTWAMSWRDGLAEPGVSSPIRFA